MKPRRIYHLYEFFNSIRVERSVGMDCHSRPHENWESLHAASCSKSIDPKSLLAHRANFIKLNIVKTQPIASAYNILKKKTTIIKSRTIILHIDSTHTKRIL